MIEKVVFSLLYELSRLSLNHLWIQKSAARQLVQFQFTIDIFHKGGHGSRKLRALHPEPREKIAVELKGNWEDVEERM